jgi:hypothetical protein
VSKKQHSSVLPTIIIPRLEDQDTEAEVESDNDSGTDNDTSGNGGGNAVCNHVMWSHNCDPKNYQDATDFLSLCMDPADAKSYVQQMQGNCNDGDVEHYKARDILRAAKTDPADTTDPDVINHTNMMQSGVKMNPVLLVRGSAKKNGTHAIIADGYHRTSAAMRLDPQMVIPCVVATK